GNFFFEGVHVLLAASIDGATAITEDDITKPIREQQLGDADGRRTRAVDDDLHIFLLFAYELERVDKARKRNDGCAVLIIVKNRNIARFLQLSFDLKAAWRRDILKVNATEGAADEADGVHD